MSIASPFEQVSAMIIENVMDWQEQEINRLQNDMEYIKKDDDMAKYKQQMLRREISVIYTNLEDTQRRARRRNNE